MVQPSSKASPKNNLGQFGLLVIAHSLFGGLGQKSAEGIISFAQRPTSLLINHPLLKQMFRHHDALHLIGALIDLGDLGVPHEALHRKLLGKAVSSE